MELSRVGKIGSVVSILGVLTKRGGVDKKPQTLLLRYVEDFSLTPTKVQSSYQSSQQKIIFTTLFGLYSKVGKNKVVTTGTC